MVHPRNIVKTSEVIGVCVKNPAKEDLGEIEEIMLDKYTGNVAYAVLASGGFLGMGEDFYAIPWKSFHYNKEEDCFILNVDKDRLKNAPGFDKDHWPDMSDVEWGQTISRYYQD